MTALPACLVSCCPLNCTSRQQWSQHTHFGHPQSAFCLHMEECRDRDGDTESGFSAAQVGDYPGVRQRPQGERTEWPVIVAQVSDPKGLASITDKVMPLLSSCTNCTLVIPLYWVMGTNAAKVNSWVFVSKGESPAVHSLLQCRYRCIHEGFHS